MRAQLTRRGRFNLANHISHESLISPLVFARDNYGFANLWVRCQCRFNFSQLDPEAAHFHLMIAPAAILDVSIRQEAAQIPSAEKSCGSVWTKRIGNKFFGVQLRPIEITVRQSHAADENLSRHADWRWLQIRVKNIDLSVGNGTSNRNTVKSRGTLNFVTSDVRSYFGRPVKINQFCVWQLFTKLTG